MFSRIHSKLGTAGLIVAVVALVAALAGGAYAASGLNKQQKKQVRNISKNISKKQSKNWSKKFSKRFSKQFAIAGPAGPAGPQGPAGPAGAKGANGANGANGADGEDGATGPTGADGEDGATGATGAEGSPWTAGGTLPPGETLTGAWAFGKETAAHEVDVAISFALPLAAELGAGNVHFLEQQGPDWKEAILNESTFEPELVTPTDCLGTAEEPTAEPGHLCIYADILANAFVFSNFSIFKAGSSGGGTSTTGSRMTAESEINGRGKGTYAVTAPTP